MISPRFTPRPNEPVHPPQADALVSERTRKKQLAATNTPLDPHADPAAQLHSLLQQQAHLEEQVQLLKKQLVQQARTSEHNRTRNEERFLEQMAASLVPIIDNCHRATNGAQEDDPMYQGFVMLQAALGRTLSELGIELFTPQVGEQFDPKFHEAVDVSPSKHRRGSITRVVAVGYRKNEGMVRVAQVIVSE